MTNKTETFIKFKRGLLALVIAGILGVLYLPADGQSLADASAKKTLEGSWRVTITPGPAPFPLPPTIEGLVTYVPGGGLVETDNLAAPGSLAAAGLGIWKATGGREYKIQFVKYLFTTQGQLQGSVRIIETITRDPKNDNLYTGEGRIETLSPTGTIILVIPATTQAERIELDQP